MKYKELDLTVGNITKKLIFFGTPLFLANLLQSFYSMVDMLVVGNVVGSTGLAAISNASMISFIINSIGIGLSTGGSVLIAQYKGARDLKGQKETVCSLIALSAAAAIIVTILGIWSYPYVFRVLHVPESAMKDACTYMFIVCCGTIFVFGYQAVCAIMRGLGDSKSPLYFVLVAAIVNIVLDIFLVGPCEMGTKGAAYATVFAQGSSFVFSAIHLRKKHDVFDIKIRSSAIKKDKIWAILDVGIPSAVQMAVVNVSFLIITGMLNIYGVEVAAASGIGLKINTFAGMPCWAVGQAVTSMAGQNMGAKKIDRVRKTTRTGLAVNLSVTLFSVILVQIFAGPVIRLFDPENVAVVDLGILYLRICCSANSLVYAAMYTFDSFATGVGAARLAMFNSLLDSVVVRLLAAWVLGTCAGMGFMGIYIGQALSPILPAIVGAVYFKKKRWEGKTIIPR